MNSEIRVQYTKGFVPVLEGRYVIEVDGESFVFNSQTNGSSFQFGLMTVIKRVNRKAG